MRGRRPQSHRDPYCTVPRTGQRVETRLLRRPLPVCGCFSFAQLLGTVGIMKNLNIIMGFFILQMQQNVEPSNVEPLAQMCVDKRTFQQLAVNAASSSGGCRPPSHHCTKFHLTSIVMASCCTPDIQLHDKSITSSTNPGCLWTSLCHIGVESRNESVCVFKMHHVFLI